jgi:hypothetical protein
MKAVDPVYKVAYKLFSFTAAFMIILMLLSGYTGIASGNSELFQIIPVAGLGALFSGTCMENLKKIEKKHKKED